MNRTIFYIIICCFCIFTCKPKEPEKPKEEIKKTGNIDKPSLNLSLRFRGPGRAISSDTIDGNAIKTLKYPYSIDIVNDSIMIFTSWNEGDNEYRGKLTEEQHLKIKNLVSALNQEYEKSKVVIYDAMTCVLKIDNKVFYEKKACAWNHEFTISNHNFPPMPKEILLLFQYIVDLPPARIMQHRQMKNKPHITQGTFTDTRDGKIYKTAKIDEQVWLAENLSYEASGSKCYKNEPANCKKYGRLYNWETAMKVCPKGWHLPSKAEWDVLTIGGYKYFGDTSGFSALKGGSGYTLDSLSFTDIGHEGYWWIAGKYNNDTPYRGFKFYKYEYVGNGSGKKDYSLYSVRCVQD